MTATLRISGKHHAVLRKYLFPGDGNEAVAVILCGRHRGAEKDLLLCQSVHTIPYEDCSVRTPDRVTWSTRMLQPLLQEAAKKGLSVVKVHSHPGDYRKFSTYDDQSDRDLFPSVYGWLDSDFPNGSAVMLADGTMFGRVVTEAAEFAPFESILIAGDDLFFWPSSKGNEPPLEFMRRTEQAFGRGTTKILRQLTVAIIGCSGTGSFVAEELARLGVGRIILVDPDLIEEKNLNRILNSTARDAKRGFSKVAILRRAIRRMGLGTVVDIYQKNLFSPEVIRAVAMADVVFGCVDTAEGRHLLNRLATFYLIPYIDVGVRLVADGKGNVDHVCGTINYLQPGGSSLLSRGLFSLEQVRAEGLKRTDPLAYADQLKAKYITGVNEDRPAVISVNGLLSNFAINELLARLHRFRNQPNSDYAIYRVSLEEALIQTEPDGNPCTLLSRHVGRGDVLPLLELASLSERRMAS